jgi:ABC-2 type transport system permease protein
MNLKTIRVFWKDFLILMKDRGTYINLFVLPIMFSVVLTFALGGVFGGGANKSPVKIPVVASSSSATRIVTGLEKIPGITWQKDTQSKAKSLVQAGKVVGAVLVSNNGRTIQFYEDPDELTDARLVLGEINSYMAAQTLGTRQSALVHAAASSDSVQFKRDLSAIMGTPATQVVPRQADRSNKSIQPTASEQYIPGFTVAFLFFIASTIAQYMFMERERGTLRRLLTSPVRRYSILLGKLLPNIIIGFGQVAVIFAVGRLLFHMHLGNLPALFLVSCAAVAAANGFGLMITALSKTQAQATGLATLFVFTLATLAGCYVPLFLMPGFMQNVAMAIPQGWAMSAYQDIIIKGANVVQVLPNIAVLCGFAIAFFLVGLSRFRFDT